MSTRGRAVKSAMSTWQPYPDLSRLKDRRDASSRKRPTEDTRSTTPVLYGKKTKTAVVTGAFKSETKTMLYSKAFVHGAEKSETKTMLDSKAFVHGAEKSETKTMLDSKAFVQGAVKRETKTMLASRAFVHGAFKGETKTMLDSKAFVHGAEKTEAKTMLDSKAFVHGAFKGETKTMLDSKAFVHGAFKGETKTMLKSKAFVNCAFKGKTKTMLDSKAFVHGAVKRETKTMLASQAFVHGAFKGETKTMLDSKAFVHGAVKRETNTMLASQAFVHGAFKGETKTMLESKAFVNCAFKGKTKTMLASKAFVHDAERSATKTMLDSKAYFTGAVKSESKNMLDSKAFVPGAEKSATKPMLDSKAYLTGAVKREAYYNDHVDWNIIENETNIQKLEQDATTKAREVDPQLQESTLLKRKTEPQQPIFSRSWQFQESFSSGGGQLQGADSDVVLSLPENAIVADSQRVTIYGAVSTDLDSVQEKLKLCEEEVISSPVVEYFAGEMFSFRDTVCISLPHFLPPGVAACEIKVYQAHQDDEGKIFTELLRCSADTEPKSDKRAAEESTDVVALGDATSVGTFCLSNDNRINILTRHFTGYFCTVCRKRLDPYLIAIRLYGEHVRRLTQEVDLNLFIGDQRLNIRDFRKTVIPDATKEQTFVACQTLAPVPADDVASVQLGVSLGFLGDAQTVWVHKRRPGGAPLFPAQKRLDLLGFSPCCCKEPKRVEWALYLPTGTDGPQWFEGFIDIGYVKKSDTSFQFLPTPSLETLRPQLRLINGNETHGTQTDPAMAEDTYVKRCHGQLRTSVAARATSSSASPPDTTAEGPSETATSQSVSSPDTVAPGRLVRQDSSQIAANVSSRELWHDTSQEMVRNTTVFSNCSFTVNRNRNTHNNNINKLNEMNFDNNYNAEQGRAVGNTSFQEATSLGLEEIMEGSLAQASGAFHHDELMVPEERWEPLETQPHGHESELEDDMEFEEPG